MLKELLEQKNMSIYKVAQMSGVPYSTLNDLVNYKVDIENIRAGILYRIAKVLNISMDELYERCSHEIEIYSEQYATKGTVLIKNKKYVLEFKYHDQELNEVLCPVKKEATMFVESIAQWQMEKLIADLEREEAYELCIKAKR